MKKRLAVLLSVLCAVSMVTVAQDYDDIYFNSSKTKKKETKKKDNKNQLESDYYKFSDNDDFVEIENNRDVDEYNRRYVTRDTTQIDSAMVDDYADFAYTDRIQRFHNPSVVDEANDIELAELYNDSKASSVTVIVSPNTLSPNWAWSVGYNNWIYGWSSPVYSPWYYDWTWGWSGWNWYRNHHHFHHHHWCGPIHHGPIYGGGINQVVTSRPSSAGGGGRRPFGTSYRSDKGNRYPGTSINKGSHSSSSVRSSGRRPSVGRSTGSSVVNRSTGSSGSYRRSSTSRSSSYSAPPAASSSYSRSSSSSNSGSRGGSYSGGGGGGGSRSSGSSGGRR